MNEDLKYREVEYFNKNDVYLFDGMQLFESKVHFERGYWWTNKSLNYKATSIKCKLITQ